MDGESCLSESGLARVVPGESCIAALVDAGAEIDTRDDAGQTPLHTVAGLNYSVLLKMASDSVPGVHASEGVRERDRVSGNMAALIRAGAAVHLRDNEGRTPLHTAVKDGHPESVVAILNAGVDIDIGDDAGDTPRHLAASSRESENIGALLAAGADPALENRDGESPWDMARGRKELHGTDAYQRLNPTQSDAPPD